MEMLSRDCPGWQRRMNSLIPPSQVLDINAGHVGGNFSKGITETDWSKEIDILSMRRPS